MRVNQLRDFSWAMTIILCICTKLSRAKDKTKMSQKPIKGWIKTQSLLLDCSKIKRSTQTHTRTRTRTPNWKWGGGKPNE